MSEQFSILIDSRSRFETGAPGGAWLPMPATQEQLHAAMRSVGITADNPQDFFVGGFTNTEDCPFDVPLAVIQSGSMDELNYLGKLLEMQRDEDKAKFAAAVTLGEYAGNLKDLINLAQNLDCYWLYPTVQSEEDYGYYLIDELDELELPEEAKKYFMYEEYGRDASINDGGRFTEQGYVYNNKNTFSEWYNGRDIPKEYRIMSYPQPTRPDPEKVEMDAIGTRQAATLTLLRYNPEIVSAAKEAALASLMEREAKDNAIAAQKGLKPYTLLNVEFNDGADGQSSGYMGWYYVTLAVDGNICSHIETGLNYDIADGKVSAEPTREKYFAAGALKDSEVDYVFNNVGFSSASGLYALPVSDAVLQRAEKTLAERTQAQAVQRTEKDVIYTMHTNPRSESLADHSFLQAYEQQPDGKAIPGDLLFVGTPEKCRELLQSLNAGELTQGEVKALYAKAQEPDRDSFSIYQLKRGDETRDLRFEPYDRLTAAGHAVDPANYDLIYSAPLAPGTSLEAIFTRFNIDHPKDFKGHSLSVSDVVVLHQNGQDTAHYVDSIGYRQTPEFLQPQNYLKHVEDIVEQNDNNFDGIINNTPQTPTVGELEQKAKAGEPISLIDLTNAIHADKEHGKEEKPSIRAQLRAAKEQTAQRKAQRSKTQDLERI